MEKVRKDQIVKDFCLRENDTGSSEVQIALMTESDSIRDVIAFPKTQKGTCPMTGAPSAVSSGQLKELGLELKKKEGV